MKYKEFKKKAELVDPKKVADQILEWVTGNVEQFIDNQRKIYKLDIILDADSKDAESLPELKKLQDLYREIPEDKAIDLASLDDLDVDNLDEKQYALTTQCRELLDAVTKEAEVMLTSNEKLDELFARMIYYYEMVGVANGKPLIEELDGGVGILRFEYESFSVGVNVGVPATMVEKEDGQIEEVKEGSTYGYTIPEGFTLWLEIAYKPKQMMITSLF